MANDDIPDGTPPSDEPIEESLSISGNDPVSDKPVDSDSDKVDENESVNKMETNVADLSDIVSPGDDASDFLEKILVSSDQLIPWEDCYVPSRGLYYDGDWADNKIKVKAMGQTAEKILATSRLAQSGQSIDYLLRECCKFPEGFDPVNMLLGDRVFLLYFIRGITHGNIYEFVFTCPNQECGSVTTHAYDLNELASTVTWADEGLGEEPFKVVLPYMSEAYKREVYVSVRYLRAYDANDMLSRRKVKEKFKVRPGNTVRTRGQQRPNAAQRSQNQELDDTISENLEKVIVDINGAGDKFQIRQFVSQMHATDTATVREWLRENTPGIDNSVTVGCPDCNTEHTVELPITESFFRPSKRTRI